MTSCGLTDNYHLIQLTGLLVCLKAGDSYHTDVTLPFSLHWDMACCQDVTSLIIKDLVGKGLHLLNYIDDFGSVAGFHTQAALNATFKMLGIQEAVHKASPLAEKMMWLGFEFNSRDMNDYSN